MRKSNRKTMRQGYMPPRIEVFCLPEDNIDHLLETSTGQFEDLEPGGDLGGDGGNSGDFNDMGWGGNLGGNSGTSGGFKGMDWGDDLGGTVTGE